MADFQDWIGMFYQQLLALKPVLYKLMSIQITTKSHACIEYNYAIIDFTVGKWYQVNFSDIA